MQTHRDIWFSNGGDESEWLYFNTRKYPFPVLELVPYPLAVPGLIFPDGSQQFTAGGGGGGSGVSLLAGSGISLTPGIGTMTIANTQPGIPAGVTGQVQFNNGGAFGANPNLFWNNTTQRLGVGTSNPQYPLDVTGDVNITGVYRVNGVPIGTGGATLPAGTTGQIQFNNAGAFAASPNLFWNNTTQRLGLGITTPQYTLDVSGDVNVTGQFRVNGVPIGTGSATLPAGTTGQIQFNNAGAFGASAGLFWNNTTQRLGIGTTTPQYPLDVVGDIDITGVYRINGVPLTAGTPAGANGQIQFNNAGAFGANANLFWNNTNGWLGIGTATPTMPLHIYSSSNAQGMLQSASAYAVWHFVTDTANWVVGTGGSGTAGAGVSGTFYVQNGVNNSYPIAINSLGQVGINNTTSPSHTLDVQGDINIYSTTATPPAFRINGIAISPVYINTVPPDSPNEGNLWFDPFFLHMYVYHAGAWFQVSN